MTADTIFVVTGGNRGIGKEIVRQLAEKPHSRIWLTARSTESGEEARKDINAPSSVHVHALDIGDKESITKFVDRLRVEHGENSIDVLINNAGVFHSERDKLADDIRINYYGTKDMIESFLPLMKKGLPREPGYGARIINMASRGGTFSDLADGIIKGVLTNPPDSAAVDRTADAFLEECQGTDDPKWGGLNKIEEMDISAKFYKVSKAVQGAMTRLFNERLVTSHGVTVSQVCPGLVDTDMVSANPRMLEKYKAQGMKVKSVAEGADSMVWLATVTYAEEEFGGHFYAERTKIDYSTGTPLKSED